MSKKGEGEGFGKIILFGEHYVVYGLPAIAAAISDTTTATIVPTEKKYELIDNRPATEGYKVTKKGEMDRSMKLLLDFMKLDVEKNPVEITLAGELFCTSGIGASASMATSIARAFDQLYGLKLSVEEINRISYEAEKGSAGTPSGIDNTCATYGGLLWFVKNLSGGNNTMQPIESQCKLHIVLGSTGLSQETKKVVADVRKLKEDNPEEYNVIFEEYEKLVKNARDALIEGKVMMIGELMNENHRLLSKMTLTCPEAEDILEAARSAGAIGGKITGTGRGGYVIALAKDVSMQDDIAKAIESKGYRVMKTCIS